MAAEGAAVEEFLTAGQRAVYGRFEGPPSVEDLRRCFLLDDEDRKLVAKRRGDANRLGFALQLTTVRYLGTFLDDPLDVPAVVVDELADQLGIADASQVKAYTERAKTRFEHRWEICEVDGWHGFAEHRQELTRWVDHRAWATGDGPRVAFTGTVGWLRSRQVLLPAVAELERLVSRVVLAANTRFWQTLADQVQPWQGQILQELLVVPPGRRISRLEELRRGPVDRTAKALAGALRRVGQVTEIGLGTVDLSGVPPRRVVDLARVGMRANATHLRRLRPHVKQVATLVATAVELEAKATDNALELFDLIMTSELLAKAERATAAEQAKRYPRVSRDARCLSQAVAVLLESEDWDQDLSVGVLRSMIEAVVPWPVLRAAVDSITAILPPQVDPDSEWRSALSRRYPLARKFLRLLVETVEFGATAQAAPVLEAFKALPDLLDAGATKRVPAGYLDARKVAVDLVPAGWTAQVFPTGRPEGTVDRNGYVFCVLEAFHTRLKRRDIYAVASSRWADPRAQLLAGPDWQAQKETLLDSLQLPDTPHDLLAGYGQVLDEAWRHAADQARTGDLRVDADGRLHAAALQAVPEPASLVDLRQRCQAMMPRVDIADLVLEVMSWHPDFTGAYTHIAGGGTRGMGDLDITLSAILTAQALNIGWKPVISPGVEALTRARISHVYQNYVRAENHARANAPLLAGQAGVPTVALWGGGLVAAVDGTRFVVPVRSVDARANPKYFGRKKGVTYLNMINDQAMELTRIVLSGTPRDSLHSVDLMYRRDGGPRPEILISDTGSYSDMVFGLLQLLGVSYRPELADLPDTRLWRMTPGADYGPVDAASRGRVDVDRIERHWPDLLRVAASVHSGQIAASDAIRMLQHGGNPTQLGLALAHFGRIFKTLHVLAYVDREPYRRDIKRLRNLQEERHGLAKHLFHGRKGELREAYHAGMEDQLGALGLIVNAVTLWNSVYLDLALTQLRQAGHPVLDADVARLHPYWYAHLNVHGHYTFHHPAWTTARRPLRDPDQNDDED